MARLLSVLLLAASFRGCVAYEFEQEFWLGTDGSGSFTVTAPLWVWNTVKNVGDSRNLDATVNERTLGALFQDPRIRNPRVSKAMRRGQSYFSVSGGFSNINDLVGTKGFPDLVVALQREGERLRLFGVWRRPQSSGTAQGDDTGLMAVRFHLPSEIVEHRSASSGVERGNVLSWRQDLRGGLAGAPLDFGATLSTRRGFGAASALLDLALVCGLGLIAAIILHFTHRGRGKKRRPPENGPRTSPGDDDFLNYDPSSGAK